MMCIFLWFPLLVFKLLHFLLERSATLVQNAYCLLTCSTKPKQLLTGAEEAEVDADVVETEEAVVALEEAEAVETEEAEAASEVAEVEDSETEAVVVDLETEAEVVADFQEEEVVDVANKYHSRQTFDSQIHFISKIVSIFSFNGRRNHVSRVLARALSDEK